MKHILTITLKDIQETLRDRLTFLFLLAMPVVFTLLFGFAFGGSSTQNTPRPVVGWLDQDHSQLSLALKQYILTVGSVRLEDASGQSTAKLDQQVMDGKLSAVLMVPAGYEQSARAGKLLKLVITAKPEDQAEIQSAVSQAVLSATTSLSTQQAAGTSSSIVLDQMIAALQNPPANPEGTKAVPGSQASANPMGPAQSSPAMMVQFAMAGLITSAQVLVYERKSRCMQRLLTTAVARWQILSGHFLAIFVTIFVQLVLLILFGQLVFGLAYLSQPLATLVMTLATALFMAALGLLIGTLAKSDEQAIIFSLIPMFVFAGLGGAWLPLENTGQAFQVVGHFTPVAWALDGFKNIIARGLGLTSIWLPAAVLLGYAAVAAALAIWKFKFE